MHRRQFVASIGAIGLAGCQARSSSPSEVTIDLPKQTWTQYRGSPLKDGYTSKTYPSKAPGDLHLDYRLKFVALPVLDGQKILIPTPEDIVALDPSERTEIYRIPLEVFPTLPPAVTSNVLLLAGEELHGYDLNDRSLKWKAPTSSTHIRGAAPVAFANHFIVQDGNRLRCVEDESGSSVWEYSFDARLVGFAATQDAVVALRQAKHTAEIIALDTDSGSRKWSLETDPSEATPVPDDHIYSVSDSGRLIAIQDGAVSWEVETDLINPKVVSTNGDYVVLGPDDSDRFVGINKANQTKVWQTQFEFASLPLVTPDSVFVPTANDGIITLNPGSGEQQHTYSNARFVEHLVPYKGGLLLARQPDERVGFMDFASF